MNDYVDVPCVVQVQPTVNGYGEVTGGRASRLTRYQSSSPMPGAVQVLLTLRVPKTAFEPLQGGVISVTVPDAPQVSADAAVINSA